MKNIYNAPNKEAAAVELDNLEKKWGGKYPYAILSWRNNWDDLTVFFQFPAYSGGYPFSISGDIRSVPS